MSIMYLFSSSIKGRKETVKVETRENALDLSSYFSRQNASSCYDLIFRRVCPMYFVKINF